MESLSVDFLLRIPVVAQDGYFKVVGKPSAFRLGQHGVEQYQIAGQSWWFDVHDLVPLHY